MKGQSHSRHLPTLRKNWTLGKGVRPCFDVRYMATDELERELENKFAAKDVAYAEPPVEQPVQLLEVFKMCLWARWAHKSGEHLGSGLPLGSG